MSKQGQTFYSVARGGSFKRSDSWAVIVRDVGDSRCMSV